MHFIDAPLGRTPVEAEAGTLDAMVGADDAVFAIVKPVIECWAANIVHLDPVGSGHSMKIDEKKPPPRWRWFSSEPGKTYFL